MLQIVPKKIFLKLMVNCTFGKTMENLKTKNVRLVNKGGDFKKICKHSKYCFTENI